MNSISKQFYHWGWLIPAVLPLTQLGGRALFNLVVLIYFIWGAVVFIYEKTSLNKRYLLLFCLLLISYSLSIPWAADSSRAMHKWINYFVMASVFPITWMVLETKGEAAATSLVKWVALLGIAMVVVAYAQLLYLLLQPEFYPQLQLKEDSMPYLLPFILLFVSRMKNIEVRWLGIIIATSAVLFYVFVSEGRAAQLAAILALFIFFIAALDIRWYIACLVSIACMLAVILGNMETFVQLSGNEQGIYDVMNRFTSFRWELWDHALTHAPDWNLIGYGMGNIRYIDEIVTFTSGVKVAHLHNFILDIWFETGWLGLITFLVFITSIVSTAIKRLASIQLKERVIVGAALAGSGAILVAGLFSFSYNSRPFGVYLMLCLALLLWSSISNTSKEHDAG